MNTTKNQEKQILPQLIKGSATYKLIVPEKVEEKIKYLLRKFPSTEWSGVLFTTHEGTFEGNDLVITCQDIYPMDLGNAVYTEFNMSEDVAAYMAENIDLFNCELMLIHSHHSMPTTPSGTDLSTLREEGNERNCFVSLIVNNAGKYYAAITRKVQTKSEVTVKNLGTSYEFFGEGSKDIAKNNSETTKVISKDVVEYFDLEVERHEVQNSLSYLDTRFEEIEKKKHAADLSKQVKFERGDDVIDSNKGFLDWLHDDSKKLPKEQSLFEEPKFQPKGTIFEDEEEVLKKVTSWKPDPKKIHKAVCCIITCNLIINPDKFDLRQWVTRHMGNVYKRLFENENVYDNSFGEWRDFIVQFTLDHFDVSDVPDSMLDDMELLQSRIAAALIEELDKYSKGNEYIHSYCELLEQYIIE